jgi:tetratricopeptide (TPR) repeat protein
MAGTYHALGITAQDGGRLEEAEDWYRKAISIFEELGDRPGMARIYHSLGRMVHDGGRLEEAEDWFRRSLAIKEELGDRPSMAITYDALGRIAQDGGRLEEAEDWYRRSLAIKEELGDRPGMAPTYHQLGMAAQDGGRLEEAEDWYHKAISIFEELGDRPNMASTYHQLGRIAEYGGRLEEAEDWYRRSLGIEQELGNRPGMAISYAVLGLLAENRGHAMLALQQNILCVTLFDQFPSPLTVTGPAALARLSRQLGMPALEDAWRQVTGQPVPQAIRDYITSQPDQAPVPRTAMTDPAAAAARAASVILAPDLGQNLPVEVEIALAARGTAQRPGRYVDPVSLAGLIVAIATLAWTIYTDQRDRKPAPPPASTIARQVRITLREQDIDLPAGGERITEVIATEIIRLDSPLR